MGSRTRGNYGGTGEAKTRQDWIIHKRNPRKSLENNPLKDRNDLEIYLSGDFITCLECGQDCLSLGHHLSRTHNMKSSEYKIKYNIPIGRSLRGVSSRQKSSIAMKKVWQDAPDAEQRKNDLRIRAEKNLIGVGTYAARTSTLENPVYRKNCPTCREDFYPINKYQMKKRRYCSKECHFNSDEEKERLKNIAFDGAKASISGCERNISGKFTARNGNKK